jgi:4,5-DOPA dioxygenase extradiol
VKGLGKMSGKRDMIASGINDFSQTKTQIKKMPALFIGHGSPMNAIKKNSFTETLFSLGKKIPIPKVVLVISAHWLTDGTWITKMEKPKTIHDFFGFPSSLFEIQYPAPGSPAFAGEIQNIIKDPKILADTENWGLDHGTWSILRHIYPAANIPVLQLSLNMAQSHEYHFKLGQELSKLRETGVLIIGSGNIVHNLHYLNWNENATPHDWAIEFDEWSKEKIIKRDFKALQTDILKIPAGILSLPTMDHYYPLHYILGLASMEDEIKFEYEEIQNSSISMRTLSVGLS